MTVVGVEDLVDGGERRELSPLERAFLEPLSEDDSSRTINQAISRAVRDFGSGR